MGISRWRVGFGNPLLSSTLHFSHLPHETLLWSFSCYLEGFPNIYALPVSIRPELVFTAVNAYQGLLTINRRESTTHCLCFLHPSSFFLLDLPVPPLCKAFTNTLSTFWHSKATIRLQSAFSKSPALIWRADQQTQAAK